MLILLPLSIALAHADDVGEEPADLPSNEMEACEGELEVRAPRWSLPIYREPDTSSRMRGRLLVNEAFYVVGRVEGRGCNGSEGWGLVAGDGYVCLDSTNPSDEEPMALPRLTTFDHPDPDEYFTYLETGEYDRQDLTPETALVPFIYAKPWRTWTAPLWSSLDSWNAGRGPSGNLGTDRKYYFPEFIDTERGTVFRRNNGAVVPADRIFLYPITRFHGRDMRDSPVAEGRLPAWVHAYDGAPIYASPEEAEEPVLILPYHQELSVLNEPADESGHWWEIPDALGDGIPGYANDQTGIRHWVPRPSPEDVEPDELWIDVDRGQQILALRRGEESIFVTLVSTGVSNRYPTPLGVYRIMSKTVYSDMASRPESTSPYHVERVPWAASFWPRYALHGTYWHWGFGHSASRGCINLSPRDARYIFDRIHPLLPQGWGTVYETVDDPGLVLRVREGPTGELPDRRRSLGDGPQVSR